MQLGVRHRYEAVGCDVTNLSQVRKSMVTVGIGDLYVMKSGFGGWWHETKRQNGVQSLDQERFERRCRAHGIGYVLGGEYEALIYMQGIGLWRLPDGRTWDEFAVPTIVRKQSEIDARTAARERQKIAQLEIGREGLGRRL